MPAWVDDDQKEYGVDCFFMLVVILETEGDVGAVHGERVGSGGELSRLWCPLWSAAREGAPSRPVNSRMWR